MKTDENTTDFGLVTKHVKGGTMLDYYDFLKASGFDVFFDEKSLQLWFPHSSNFLLRYPFESLDTVKTCVIKKILKKKGIWIISYSLNPSEQNNANCFDYVCSDNNYFIDNLHKNARRDIRRGLRNFEIRLCSWDELVKNGYKACADTNKRHGYSLPPEDSLEKMASRYRADSPFFEIWGAWDGPRLVAWLHLVKVDDWALINMVRSCTETLKLCPNNAILYSVTRRALVAEKRKYITFGLSSIQPDANQQSTHKYKLRMGYEPLPLYRAFEMRPILKPLFKSKVGSWIVEEISNKSSSAKLLKIAGLSRIISGREKNLLDWADQ